MGLLVRAESIIAQGRKNEQEILIMKPEGTIESTHDRLHIYVQEMEQRGYKVFVLELTIATLLDQLTKESDDPIQEEEIVQQWVDLLHDLLREDSFVLHTDKEKYVIIYASERTDVKEFLLSGIVDFASDVFGISAQHDWFEPYFYEMDASAKERFTVWIQ